MELKKSYLVCPSCKEMDQLNWKLAFAGDEEGVMVHFYYICKNCNFERVISKFATVSQKELFSAYEADKNHHTTVKLHKQLSKLFDQFKGELERLLPPKKTEEGDSKKARRRLIL